MAKRVFLIVLDSFGIGAAPDASRFGDEYANTFASIAKTEKLNIPNLISLGLGNIDGIASTKKESAALGTYLRLEELSQGKDTTTGHWEMMGIISQSPMPTYPNGFPDEVITAFETAVGRKTICNLPYSGTNVIKDYGEEHIKTGDLIVYTSADSVFQIAAHEDIVPLDELYKICEIARNILQGKHGVCRVIARPFTGTTPDFKRTENRRDFSLPPPKETFLDKLLGEKLDVIGVGKIGDIFCGKGLSESYPTHNNREGMMITKQLCNKDFNGLCFTNLVDFDMLYGHRQDPNGYANALNEFDYWLGNFMKILKNDDVLIITADHGCDPSDDSTDHTREYVPCLMYGKNISTKNGGTISGFDFIGKTVYEFLV